MRLSFVKMHGCGNDYIYFNCFNKTILNPEALSQKLSSRRFSIGSDGIILILPSEKADAKMKIFNADGSEAKMCGNGIRCVGKYLFDSNLARKNVIKIETLSGIKTINMHEDYVNTGLITVNMGKASFKSDDIPVSIEAKYAINQPIFLEKKEYKITCVSMGNPHCVVFCNDLNDLNIEKIGPTFEHSALFPDSVNTEFAKIIDMQNIQMRVWERGSGETLACGTGACAVVSAAVKNGYCKKNSEVTVALKGGILKIKYTDDAVFMTGTAEKTFEGVVEI